MKRKGWWWLSFVGEEGSRGACYVEGVDFEDAIDQAWRLKINPGGEVLGSGPFTDTGPLPTNRLLSRDEVRRASGH